MTGTRATLLKGSGLLTAAMGLSFGFVAMPSITGPASVPAATPARNTPVTPRITTHALTGAPQTSVAAAGPQTKVIDQATLPRDTNGKVVAPAGAVALDPALEAGQADDTVVDLAATGDLVGITWPATTTVAPRATVAVRARNDQGWQDWQELTVDAVRDQRTGVVRRYGTDPLWVDGATRVQIRVAPEAKALLRTASLAAITSPTTAADAQLTPQATPGAADAAYAPGYISRAGWGANESLRKGCVPTINPTTQVVVVHHTAGTNSYTAAQSASILRGIYAYDTGSLGWCDVAYNMVVDKYGQKFEGRYGGLNRPVKGAHADSFNTRTFGISILGNYDVAAVPSAGMWALKQGIAMRLSQFYLNPYGKTTMYSEYNGTTSRFPKGAAYYANNIAGHRESSYTACPGRYLYPRLGELRDGAAALAGWTGSGYNSPIYKRYAAGGGAARYGYVNVGESLVSGMARTAFTSGRFFYSTPAGVKIIGPGINATWMGLGGWTWAGHPTTDEVSTANGWYVHFSKGITVTSDRSGLRSWTGGSIRGYWLKRGGMWGSLGAPTAPMQTIPGGWQQQFAGGVIKADRATGAVWLA
ncbi:N-acetylmuramoyl-L-alanine amidase [Arsenicicoccus dermatophilus]|uniref:N-acetylmuramoyl-L-alanine amidase n=1 Tax=Arsenicicoccus dermatophilus TaxID=1076331 RepID=UPI0039176508